MKSNNHISFGNPCTQCAAVNTNSLVINEPPHLNGSPELLYSNNAIQGNSLRLVSFPPAIRLPFELPQFNSFKICTPKKHEKCFLNMKKWSCKERVYINLPRSSN